MINQKSRADIS